MSWTKLAAMAGISFIVMYILMYMMVDRFENVYPNINQFYMAAAMTAAMMLIEIAIMKSMYERRVQIITVVASIVGLVIFVAGVRYQTAVSDKQFLLSMIPHHAAALLMCEKANLEDPEIKALCQSIVSGQQREIDWMEAKLSTFK